MLVDIFTKATDKTDFYRLRNVMMNCLSTLRDALKLAVSYLRGASYFSVVDHINRVDEGGPGHPYPAGTLVQVEKARLQYRRKAKAACGLIIQHVAKPGLYAYITRMHFQNVVGAKEYLESMCCRVMDHAELRKLGKQWDALEVFVGVVFLPNTLKMFAQEIRHLTPKFPGTDAKNETDMTRRVQRQIRGPGHASREEQERAEERRRP